MEQGRFRLKIEVGAKLARTTGVAQAAEGLLFELADAAPLPPLKGTRYSNNPPLGNYGHSAQGLFAIRTGQLTPYILCRLYTQKSGRAPCASRSKTWVSYKLCRYIAVYTQKSSDLIPSSASISP